uniref:Dr1-associated corepressor n=2 Tax=Cacopsylla melanoneura TaxID=428564 RepID=A0A8D8Q1F4_9HEMI
MPSKKKKYNARFPAGRIKKIMQSDEDVGKVAQAVPVIISRTLELFVESLLKKTVEITNARNAKTLTPSHLKQCILSEKRFDFLSDLVKNIPDAVNEEETQPNNEVTNSSCSSSSVPRRRTSAETRQSKPNNVAASGNSAATSNSCGSSSLVSSSSSSHSRLSHKSHHHVPQPTFQVSSSTPSPSGSSYTPHLNQHIATAHHPPQPGHNFTVSQLQQSQNSFTVSHQQQSQNSFTVSHQPQNHNNFTASQHHQQSPNNFTVSHQQQNHNQNYSVCQPSYSPTVSHPSLSHLNHHKPSLNHTTIHKTNSSHLNHNANPAHMNHTPSQPSPNITISAPNFTISIPSVENDQYIPQQPSYAQHIPYPQSHETQSSQSGNSGSGFQLNVCPSASVPTTATFNNMVPSYAPSPVSNLVIDEDYDN